MKRQQTNRRSGSLMWAAVLAVIFCMAIGGTVWMHEHGAAGKTARIYQKGVLMYEIDLSAVADPYTFTVTSELGSNTISVRSGAISVSDADCSDHTCVKQGWLETSAVPIVCLPHELVIQLEKETDTAAENELDAIAG